MPVDSWFLSGLFGAGSDAHVPALFVCAGGVFVDFFSGAVFVGGREFVLRCGEVVVGAGFWVSAGFCGFFVERVKFGVANDF